MEDSDSKNIEEDISYEEEDDFEIYKEFLNESDSDSSDYEEEYQESEQEQKKEEKNNKKTAKKSRLSFYLLKFSRFFSIGLIMFCLSSFQSHVKTTQENQMLGYQKILSLQEMIDELISNIDYYSKSSQSNFYSFLSALEDLGKYLNNTKTKSYAIAGFKSTDFSTRLQQYATNIAFYCESPSNAKLLQTIFLLLHDYVLSDETVRVNKEAVKTIFKNCGSMDVMTGLFSFLTIEAQTDAGRRSMKGLGPALEEFATSQEFGTPAFLSTVLFSLLVDNGKLSTVDGEALYKLVKFAEKNRQKWSSKYRVLYTSHESKFGEYEPRLSI